MILHLIENSGIPNGQKTYPEQKPFANKQNKEKMLTFWE